MTEGGTTGMKTTLVKTTMEVERELAELSQWAEKKRRV